LLIHTFFDGIAIASGFLVFELGSVGSFSWLFPATRFRGIHRGVGDVPVDESRIRWGASGFWGSHAGRGAHDGAFPPSGDEGLPLAGGVRSTVAASDLIPEVNKERV